MLLPAIMAIVSFSAFMKNWVNFLNLFQRNRLQSYTQIVISQKVGV